MSTTTKVYHGASTVSRANLSLAMTSRKEFHRRRAVRDDFGRKVTVLFCMKTEKPAAPISLPGPVGVPNQYLDVPADEPWRLAIDWVGYIRDLKEARRQWDIRVRTLMEKLYLEQADGMEPTARVLKLAGPAPEDWRVVELARRGDRWALGLQEERTPAVRAVLGSKPFHPQTIVERAREDDDSVDLGDEIEELLAAAPEALARRVVPAFTEVLADAPVTRRRRPAAFDRADAEAEEGSFTVTGDGDDLDEEADPELAAALAEEFGEVPPAEPAPAANRRQGGRRAS